MSSGGSGPYRSGYKYETEVVEWLKAMGLEDTKRVPLSGATSDHPDDITTHVPGMGDQVRLECKFRGNEYDRTKTMRKMLGDADILITRPKGKTDEHWIFVRGSWFERLVKVVLHQNKALTIVGPSPDNTNDKIEDLLEQLRKALE